MYQPLALEQIRQEQAALRRRVARGPVPNSRNGGLTRPTVRREATLRLAALRLRFGFLRPRAAGQPCVDR